MEIKVQRCQEVPASELRTIFRYRREPADVRRASGPAAALVRHRAEVGVDLEVVQAARTRTCRLSVAYTKRSPDLDRRFASS
jgi:hypothetical protein